MNDLQKKTKKMSRREILETLGTEKPYTRISFAPLPQKKCRLCGRDYGVEEYRDNITRKKVYSCENCIDLPFFEVKEKTKNWKIINFQHNQSGRNVYSCQDCPNRYFEIFVIENLSAGKLKTLCEGCLEPYFVNNKKAD